MNISLDRYRTFYTVALSSSISRASEQLGISQPAVSQSIALLEKQLGCQLFARSPRGVTLTAEGAALLPFVSQAMAMLGHAQRHFEELGQLATGRLRIGASDTLCKYWLLPRLSEFHARYPGIALQVTNRTSRETLNLLRDGQVDIGLVHLPLEVPAAYQQWQVMSLHDCFYYAPAAFSDLRSVYAAKDLVHLPLILLERESASRRFLDSAFADLGLELAPSIELGSLDLMLDFARAGLGICAGVAEFFEEPAARLGLRRLDVTPRLPPRAIALITHRHVPLPHSAQAFLDFVHPNEKETVYAD